VAPLWISEKVFFLPPASVWHRPSSHLAEVLEAKHGPILVPVLAGVRRVQRLALLSCGFFLYTPVRELMTSPQILSVMSA